MDLVFSDGTKLDQSDLFPKATLYDFEPRRLVVHKQDGTTIGIQNPTERDVELLDSNGVIVAIKKETGIREIPNDTKSS
jgi:hypothetical protein